MSNAFTLDDSMNEWADAFAAWLGLGAGAGGGFFAIRWLLEYFAGRLDKRTIQIDQATERLIQSLEDRIIGLVERLAKIESDLDECKHRHAESDAKVLKLEAILSAMGDARQHAALIVASERTEKKGE